MATRKTSDSGAFMSKYDQEVESRLKALEAETHKKPTGATQAKVDERLAALEAEVASLKSQLESKASPTVSDGSVDAKFNELVRILKMNKGLNISKLSNGVL